MTDARIRSPVSQAMRRLDELPWPPRSAAREIVQAIAELDSGLGRFPTDTEIAARMGISRTELDERLGEIRRAFAWFPPRTAGSRRPREHEDAAATERIGEAIARLPEREKLLVTLFYFEELSLLEVAEVLGVPSSRASKSHVSALLRLKSRLLPED